LILNELISNAFKYGVDKKTGEFKFEFKQNNQNELEIIIKDNGKGLPEDFDIKNTSSYGMKLVQILGQKLKADIRFINDKGLTVKIKIKKYKIAA
jgi:two-component sensor histidine kinase